VWIAVMLTAAPRLHLLLSRVDWTVDLKDEQTT